MSEQDLSTQYSALSTVEDEAGYWDSRLRAPDCTDQDRANFAAWRDSKPENRHAFETVQAIVQTLREHSSRADIRALRDAARAQARNTQSSVLRPKYLLTAAALALFSIGAITWTAKPQIARELVMAATKIAEYATAQTYETGTAQRSTVRLQDGSTVELNAKTRIRVAFTDARRKVELLNGQALFNVAKNPHRPFIVRAADRDIIAIGTAFDVRLDATTMRITLIEGKVTVSAVSPAKAGVYAKAGVQSLIAGQQLIAQLTGSAVTPVKVGVPTSTPSTVVQTADTAKVTGWREGCVFIEDLTLADAVTEMNKYSQVQLRLDAPELAGLRVNGMFRAGEQQAFIYALENYFPIAARYETDEIVLTRRP